MVRSARGCAGAISCHGRARNFLGNSLVYVLLSHRAQGMGVGINLNPDCRCNFRCVYCDVERAHMAAGSAVVDIGQLAAELRRTLAMVHEGRLREVPAYRALPDQLLTLRQVAISGDGEPTLSPRFVEALEGVVHLRALGQTPFFKLVLLTNSSELGRAEVREAIRRLPPTDEVWCKLDAGTQAYMNRVNRTEVPLTRIWENILSLARVRSVVIQSMFCSLDGEPPSVEEVEHYAERLRELREGGARISLVRVCSANRDGEVQVRHLALRQLSAIARRVQRVAGLRAEVF